MTVNRKRGAGASEKAAKQVLIFTKQQKQLINDNEQLESQGHKDARDCLLRIGCGRGRNCGDSRLNQYVAFMFSMRFPRLIPSFFCFSSSFRRKVLSLTWDKHSVNLPNLSKVHQQVTWKKIHIKALKVYKCRKSLKQLIHQPAQNELGVSLCSIFLLGPGEKAENNLI